MRLGTGETQKTIDWGDSMTAIDPSIELVAPLSCDVGENPLWHPEAEALFFLDITAGRVYAYHPAKQKCTVAAQTRITRRFHSATRWLAASFSGWPNCGSMNRDGMLREVTSRPLPGKRSFQ